MIKITGWLVSKSSKSENHYQKKKKKMGKISSIRHFEYNNMVYYDAELYSLLWNGYSMGLLACTTSA